MSYNQDTFDFWSQLNGNYRYCMELHALAIANGESKLSVPSYVCYGPLQSRPNILEFEYDRTRFCMAESSVMVEYCEPMCLLFQNCELHENFICPDWDIKLLMDTCCDMWTVHGTNGDKFECDIGFITAASTTYPETISTSKSTTQSLMNHTIVTNLSAQFEHETEFLTSTNDSIDQTSLFLKEDILAYILPVALILLAVFIVGIFYILKKLKIKAKYKASQVQRTQSFTNEAYAEYGSHFHSTEQSTDFPENLNYVSNL